MCISAILDPQRVAAEVLGGISKDMVQGQDPNRHHNLQMQTQSRYLQQKEKGKKRQKPLAIPAV